MLITNGTVITFDAEKRVIHNGAVYYEDDTIVDVGPSATLESQYPSAEKLDAEGKIIMPGMICAHTHFYGGFARGMAIPGEPAANFMAVLQNLWWKIDRALTLEDCKYTALVALVDAIRHGTTTLIDHHASPNAIDGSLDALAEAGGESGLRLGLCYEVTDRNGHDGATAGIRENVRFLKRLQANPDPKLGASFGLHASFTCSDATLDASVSAVQGLESGFHIHVAEAEADEEHCLAHHGKRVVQRLEERGILGPKTIVGHAIYADDGELEILNRTGTNVAHQPRSNMNNGVGVAPVETMLDKGICVGLGNDGFSNNMFSEIHTAFLVHKVWQSDPRVMQGDRLIDMAFANNAQIARNFFPQRLGTLTPGAAADIILQDYHPYTPLTEGNYPWHIIFGLDGSHVTHTICGGEMLMANRQLLTLNEEAIAARARTLAPKIWQRVEAF